MEAIKYNDAHQFSYQDLKNEGWRVFGEMAKECLTYAGDAANPNSRFFIVLTKSQDREETLILATAATAERFANRLQNIENQLRVKYRFVHISRSVSDKQTVDSFLADAREINVEGSEGPKELEDRNTPIAKFRAFIADAIERKASDIHWYVEPDSSRAAFRIDGDMSYEKGFNKYESRLMMSSVLQEYAPGFRGYESDSRKIDLPIDITVERRNKQGETVNEQVRIRLNRQGNKDREGWKAVMRIQYGNREHSGIDSLGYEPWMEKLLSEILDEPNGIFLATGKIGSGKTTTIAAMLELKPETHSGNSIEDPIEIPLKHKNIQQVQVDNEDPKSTLERLLHDSLRQDPDFINVAEVRSPEVAALLLRYARIGCVMTSTLHTNDSITSFARLNGLGVTLKELADTELFLGFMSQRLLKKLCPDCKKTEQMFERQVFVRNSNGCETCASHDAKPADLGYQSGRIAVAELLVPSEDLAPFILKEEWSALRIHLLKSGFKTMALRALELTEKGDICANTALSKIPHFKQVLTHVQHYQNQNER